MNQRFSVIISGMAVCVFSACNIGVVTYVSTDAQVDSSFEEDDADTDSGSQSLCGNGIVDPGEYCDIAIADGEPGSCPTSCHDDDPCSTVFLVGIDCRRRCLISTITNFIHNDGCCPAGGNHNLDNDCEPVCGNGVIEEGETCDPPSSCPADCNDGDPCTIGELSGTPEECTAECFYYPVTTCLHDDGCCPPGCNALNDNDCEPVCGNDVVEPGETCDPPSSCPADCNDGDPCTIGELSGTPEECTAECFYHPLTACLHDDGCCPPGCNAENDNDCEPVCGNGVVEPGETCDPPSSCPTDCDDGNPCTINTLTGTAEECNVLCTHEVITECVEGDDCCPAGCNALTDPDCSASCGNGIIEPGETCDPPSSCPTDCDDGDPCTVDTMTGSPENCNVTCSYTEITGCDSDDGCCPPGCNANNDNDCEPVCGNNVIEPGETCDPPSSCPTDCDDGDPCTIGELSGTPEECTAECSYYPVTTCLDDDGCCPPGCNADNDNDCEPETTEVTAFRVNWIALRDPHVFLRILFTCYDVTDSAPFGSQSVNEQMNESLATDSDGDGFLDLSLMILFRPLNEDSEAIVPSEVGGANCTEPIETTVCDVDPENPLQTTTSTNLGDGVCLEPYPDTVRPYSPEVAPTEAPPTCFFTELLDIAMILQGTVIVLHDAQIAAVYDGSPDTCLISGLIRGFMSEEEAQDIMVDLGSLGTQSLASLLQPEACGPGDDRDYGLDGTTLGWWFYFNFTAEQVVWEGP